MIILIIFGYLLLGILVGFVAGAFGIGGGVVMVPSFLFLFSFHGFPSELIPKFAIGSSLFASVLASSTGAFTHMKNKNIDVKLGIIVGLFAIISGFFLSLLAVKLDARTLKLIFASILILVSIRLFTDQTERDNHENQMWKYSYLIAPFLGILVGSLSAFAGIGGGIIAVPVLHYLFKVRFKTSIGTSNLIIVFSAFSAVISYIYSGIRTDLNYPLTLGYVFLLAGFPAGIGTMISARWGANFTHKANIKKLKILFAVLILLIDIRIFFEVFR